MSRNTATVHPGPFIEKTAHVRGNAHGGPNVELRDQSIICDNVKVSGHVVLEGSAKISGDANISGSLIMSGNTELGESVQVHESAHLIMRQYANMCGDAIICVVPKLLAPHRLNRIHYLIILDTQNIFTLLYASQQATEDCCWSH